MRAILVDQPGGPETMHLADMPTPSPGESEALVEVEAIGVNFIDTYHRGGVYKLPTPFRLGREGCGTVRAVGSGVAHVRVGERVAWADVAGSYATHVLAPAERLVSVPDGVDARTAAAAMLQGMTAHYLTRSTYPLKPGETALVHAAARGMGLLLCQMGRELGARVIGVTSTEEKAALAREAGAHEVVLRSAEVPLLDAVKRAAGAGGVSVAYDGVGRDTWEASLKSLRPRGMLVLYGQASGLVPPIDPLALMNQGSVFLTRPNLAHYTATREELLARAHDVLTAIATGRLKVRVGEEHPLTDAAAAHRRLESRATTGKVLLIP